MADFQSAFDANTQSINTVASTQISSAQKWANIPGSLVKTSPSTAGYLWGYNSSNSIFVCQQPCNGTKWTQVYLMSGRSKNASAPTILDIATDESNVYVLARSNPKGKIVIFVKAASNLGGWSSVAGPAVPPTNIFSTHTYLWAQDANRKKFKIPKPVNVSQWMPVADNTVSITSSSSTALYGVDAAGNAMKSDETLQTGWAAVKGLTGIPIKTLVGNIDQTALYGIGQNSQVSRCQGDCTTKQEVSPLDTGGYMPLNLTADPTTKQLWMTSSTSGTVGNIFNRVESPDYSSILNIITPADQNRDKVVQDISTDYQHTTDVMAVNKQLGFFDKTFKQLFGSPEANITKTDDQIKGIQDSVSASKAKLDTITSIQPILLKFVLTLIIAAFVYLAFSFVGWFVHVLVLVVLGVGIYLSLNNDVIIPGVRA